VLTNDISLPSKSASSCDRKLICERTLEAIANAWDATTFLSGKNIDLIAKICSQYFLLHEKIHFKINGFTINILKLNIMSATHRAE
jgi:hypothetical protein